MSMNVEKTEAADAVVLTWDAPTAADRRAREIAEFTGARTGFVFLATCALEGRPAPCAIVEAETLTRAAEALPQGAGAVLPLLGSLARNVFVFGFKPGDRHSELLRTLSGGLLREVQSLGDLESLYDIGARREWCGTFSGLSFTAATTHEETVFSAATAGDAAALIRIGGRPFLMPVQRDGVQLFLCAGAGLADLAEPVTRSSPILSWFTRLVPLMMVLRGAIGGRAWRSEQPRACFIIDDPGLQERHGFLEYRRLIESMRRHQYSASIAFIPWNYERSDRDVAARIAAAGAPALSVHGCDHTHAEFASIDLEVLVAKSLAALDRMRIHQRTTGVPFEEVMVFPQGLFSVAALDALKATGFLAAINTDLFPSNGNAPGLTLRDILGVAVTSYAGFPLFGRRYPKNVAEFAFDLFLGKPAFVVEHHGYFRDGYAAIESFARQLRALEPRLEWSTPGAICSGARLTRTAADGTIHVRAYTNRAGNGSRSVPKWKATPVRAASISIRRHLSDFRDNYVATNRVLSTAVDGARRARRLIAV